MNQRGFQRQLQASDARSHALVDEIVALHEWMEAEGATSTLQARMQQLEESVDAERALFVELSRAHRQAMTGRVTIAVVAMGVSFVGVGALTIAWVR